MARAALECGSSGDMVEFEESGERPSLGPTSLRPLMARQRRLLTHDLVLKPLTRSSAM